MKFFPSDWRADPKLRSCSIAARGLWMEMICIMHEAAPRGSFVVNGKQVNSSHMLGLMGIAPKDATVLFVELEEAGVFSRDTDGTIFSRRMRREEERSAEAKANGKLGGNPKLKGGVKPKDNKRAKPYMACGSGLEETSPPEQTDQEEASPRAKELDRLESELRDAAGLTNAVSTGLFDLSPIVKLLDSGYSLMNDILPKLRAAAASGKTPSTWAYYVPAITEGKAKNDAIPAKAVGIPGADVVWLSEDDPRWGKVAARHRTEKGKPLLPTTSKHGNGYGAFLPRADYPELSTPTGL